MVKAIQNYLIRFVGKTCLQVLCVLVSPGLVWSQTVNYEGVWKGHFRDGGKLEFEMTICKDSGNVLYPDQTFRYWGQTVIHNSVKARVGEGMYLDSKTKRRSGSKLFIAQGNNDYLRFADFSINFMGPNYQEASGQFTYLKENGHEYLVANEIKLKKVSTQVDPSVRRLEMSMRNAFRLEGLRYVSIPDKKVDRSKRYEENVIVPEVQGKLFAYVSNSSAIPVSNITFTIFMDSSSTNKDITFNNYNAIISNTIGINPKSKGTLYTLMEQIASDKELLVYPHKTLNVDSVNIYFSASIGEINVASASLRLPVDISQSKDR